MTRLSVTLFGAPRFEVDGVPLDITNRKPIALLAYLALTGVSHTRDALANMFWPEADQQHARGTLRLALTQLKAALGDGWLEITREQIGLVNHPDLLVDVRQVKAFHAQVQAHNHAAGQVCAECMALLEQAVALQRSPLLAGFSLPDSPDFDDWLFFESERLRNLLVDALATLVTYHRTAGMLKAAIAYTQRWLALDPLEETVNQLLIQLYLENNQHTAARRYYAAFAKLLQDELGAVPDPATNALIEQLAGPSGPEALRQSVPIPHHPPPAQPAARPTSRLPTTTTPLIGRAHELQAISTMLDDPTCRLLTLLGPGGSGKTRLALAVAEARQAGNVTVVFVPLAALTTPHALVATVAAAVGCSSQGGVNPQQRLLEFLGKRPYLLVLDNLEHLLRTVDDEPGAVVTLLDAMLQGVSNVQLLATSRVRVQLYEEQVYPVYGLEYPEWGVQTGVESYGAVQLFVQRARRAQHNFVLTPDKAPHVIQIVRLLAGQPLAIELAAAWITTLSLEKIATELRAGIDLLESTARNVPARHRSMRATYTISWEQLQPDEQAVQEALAVFHGGFTYEAAAPIAHATPRMLQALVDHSLLEHPREINGSMRYTVHELLRQFAAEQLARDPQREAEVYMGHSAYYLALVEKAAPLTQERPDSAHLAAMEAEYGNQLAALKWMLEQGDSEGSLQLCNGLVPLWELRGQMSEARYWLHAALALRSEQPSLARADAFGKAGWFATEQADWTQAADFLSQALSLSRALGDTRRIAQFLRTQGLLAQMRSEVGDAATLFEESLALYRSMGDKHGIGRVLDLQAQSAYRQLAFAQAVPLLTESIALSRALGNDIDAGWSIDMLGRAALLQGHIGEADQLLQQSLAIFTRLDYTWGITWVIGSLGWVRLAQAAYDQAAELFEQSLRHYSELGDKRNIAMGLERLACLAGAQGQAVRGARLFGAASNMREAFVTPLSPSIQAQYAPYLAQVHEALGADGVAAAWAEGAMLSSEQLVAYAFQHDPALADSPATPLPRAHSPIATT